MAAEDLQHGLGKIRDSRRKGARCLAATTHEDSSGWLFARRVSRLPSRPFMRRPDVRFEESYRANPGEAADTDG